VDYGNGTLRKFTSATQQLAPTSGVAGYYDWGGVVQAKVMIQNHPDSAQNMYVVWNDTPGALEVAAAKFDICLAPGESIASPGLAGEYLIKTVGVFFATVPSTGYGTDFTIRGCE
jgi:hypothetical protein